MSRDAYATYHNQSFSIPYAQYQQSYHERDYARSSYSPSLYGPRHNRDYSSDDGSSADQQQILRRQAYSEYGYMYPDYAYADNRPLIILAGPGLPSQHGNNSGSAVEGVVVSAAGLAVAYGGLYVAAASLEAATATAAMTIPIAIATLPYAAAATVTGGAAYMSWQGAVASRRRFEPYILRALRESRQTADVIRTIAEVKARHAAISSVHAAAASATTIVSTANSVAESSGQVTASLAGRISSSFTYLRGTSPWASNTRVQTVDEAASAVAIPLEENGWEGIEMQQVEPELVLDPDLEEGDVWKAMETMYKALNEGVLVWEDVKDSMALQMRIWSILRERRAPPTDTTTSHGGEPPSEGPRAEESEQSDRPLQEESSQETDTATAVNLG